MQQGTFKWKGVAVALCLLAALTATACGSDEGTTDSPADEATTDNAEGGADANTDVGPDADADTGPNADADVGPDADADVGPDADADGEVEPDVADEATPDVPPDAPGDEATVDAPPGFDGIHCADGLCSAGEVCCLTSEGQSCTARADCRGFFFAACDGSEDCPAGGLCCGTPDGWSETVYCWATCEPNLLVCGDDGDCGTGETCCPGASHGWSFSVCRTGACP